MQRFQLFTVSGNAAMCVRVPTKRRAPHAYSALASRRSHALFCQIADANVQRAGGQR